ncbi:MULTISPECIES: alpha/beta fold hydrolase [Falsihalocynthiibacter]|uniref:alpha/beta fold hydrolase n=1 Tax=Falsihalocynthiibacter TaxID=2854182 RepID=UPI0030016029
MWFVIQTLTSAGVGLVHQINGVPQLGMTKGDVLLRNNVTVIGSGEHTLLMAHGFGCDQTMWRFLTPELSKHFRIVLFDYVGNGKSDISAFNAKKYSALEGYAEDVTDICDALDLKKATLIGHSVSSMIGLIASLQSPEYFKNLVMVCPSPCFLNLPPDYFGGFDRADLEELIDLMDKNYIGWANYLAPLVMGADKGSELVGELSDSFCSTDPVIAKTFAKATFFSDLRHLLPEAMHPVLILQSSVDALAGTSIGEFVKKEIPKATLKAIACT